MTLVYSSFVTRMWLWDDSYIGCERGTAFSSVGPKEEACGELGSVCGGEDCDPDTVLEMYHYTNGTFLELNGFLEDAIYEFREAVSINPRDGFYRYNLGVALLKNGQFNEAYKELTESLRLEPDNFEARCALADVHSEIGRSLELEGREEAAADEFREAIAIDPEYPDYHACLGRVLLAISSDSAGMTGLPDQGALEAAVGHLRTALRLDPGCQGARLSLGTALIMDGPGRALDEGIALLNAVLLADPLNDEARSRLSDARKLKSRGAC